VVETGVGKVVEGRLGVGERRPPSGLADDEKLLRLAVLAKRRQAGSTEAVVEEVAFGLWHRMLFARFLAENSLLIHPELGVAVSLAECVELAESEGLGDGWMVASRFASDMLPGLFPQDDPLAQLQLLPEDLAVLEGLLEGLDREVFTSDDGLGWVYQFWQSKRKDEVNASEVKIGARELPAVTQLFTEHYMVRFLLENSLGAWWAARNPDSPLVEAFEYLRFTDDGEPAAGSFEGWPDTVAEVTVMDPCCGSGHFLTTAFEMLWRMRAEEEHLDPEAAQDAVLRDNLFGLEIDPRCTQIAAFNLALTAWKTGGYRSLPIPNVACSGIRVAGSLDDWRKLAGDDPRLQAGLEALHAQFKDADTLGSLINPKQATEGDTLLSVDYEELEPLLHLALQRETAEDPTAAIFGHQAQAITKAATYLSHQYTLVTTNPPFLGRGKQSDDVAIGATKYSQARADLSTVFVLRALELLSPVGSLAFVLPDTWRFIPAYAQFQERLISLSLPLLVVGLGPRAFETQLYDYPIGLLIAGRRKSPRGKVTVAHCPPGEPASEAAFTMPLEQFPLTAAGLRGLRGRQAHSLRDYSEGLEGLSTGDGAQYQRKFWEVQSAGWYHLQKRPENTKLYGGSAEVFLWENGAGDLAKAAGARIQGLDAWGKVGVLVERQSSVRSCLYLGDPFFKTSVAVVPKNPSHLEAIWAYCSSKEYQAAVRAEDPRVGIATSAITKVPFDVDHWSRVAAEEFPDGLPEPYSDDPTQWLFLGDPTDTTNPLQVAVARLLGYGWPDQQPDDLDALADKDGIVCLPPVFGERSAAQRLQDFLVKAFQPDNPTQLINQLLAGENAEGKTVEEWLRGSFFKQHCKLFHNRPFIWHITDGRKDGFSALVNYHKLDRDTLKRLTNTYLKWWIDHQQSQVRNEEPGAEARLAAAEELQAKLELILEGEPPYDIYVRWKPLHEQPIGWEPDLNDGVRLNVRPFVEAGVLRTKFNVKWGKDRGKNPDGTERHNDLHHTRQQKQQARKERRP